MAVVRILESAWSALQQAENEIPPAVLTLVDAKSRRRTLGYFAHSTWRRPGRRGAAQEIAISPALIGHPRELLATMVHEAAHAILYERDGSGGVGSTPYYHTRKFRDVCQNLGLECVFRNTRYGWTETRWPRSKRVPRRYRAVLALLKQLPSGTGHRKFDRGTGKKLPPPGRVRLVCACPRGGRTISAPRSVAKKGQVFCRICRKEFRRVSRQDDTTSQFCEIVSASICAVVL